MKSPNSVLTSCRREIASPSHCMSAWSMEPDTSTASNRSRPLVGSGSGSPTHSGRAAAMISSSHSIANGACWRQAGSLARARRPLSPSSSARKLTLSAASPLSAAGSRRRSSQGSGASRKIQGQANSNMLANPDFNGLVETADGLVVKAAVAAIGAFHQHHPARQTGRRAATVEKRQPGPAAEYMAVFGRVIGTRQALEQGVELLQPGAGMLAVV